jgi:DNA polymerase
VVDHYDRSVVASLPEQLAELEAAASVCVRCPLSEGRTQVVFGVGRPDADLLFVGEGPGREEDLAGEPFVGRSGKLLDRLMAEEIGIDRSQCYIANVVKCRPPDNRQIALLQPSVIITLGNFATRLLLETGDGIKKLRGHVYPYGSAQLVPTYHPAAALRSGAPVVAEMRADFVRAKRLLPGAVGR